MDRLVEERKSIINTDYDNKVCGSIPLNFINMIQPFGVLMVFDKQELTILQTSENVGELLALKPSELLKKSIEELLTPEDFKRFTSKITNWPVNEQFPVNLSFDINGEEKKLAVTVHFKEHYGILELDNAEEESEQTFIDIYKDVKYILSALREAKNIEAIAEATVTEIKRLSGFDRVMLYQFDENWNGQVIGEALEQDMEPYLGLRFPASDVPPQVRALYLKNGFRLIPDSNYVPVKLMPVVNPATKSFTDLSSCQLRGVANVHVEYLKNMKAAASMSTPIIINNKLWGLISCHHKAPKVPNYPLRASFELISDLISAQIAARTTERMMHVRNKIDQTSIKIVENLYSHHDVVKGLMTHPENILDLLHASGVAIVMNGNLHTIGNIPKIKAIRELISWLQRKDDNELYYTNYLSNEFAESIEFSESASGIMAIPIIQSQGDYILAFRAEMIENIDWGGNPEERINFEPDGKTYHPRNSFGLWRQKVRYHSIPWQPEQIEAAKNLRTVVLTRIVNRQYSSYN